MLTHESLRKIATENPDGFTVDLKGNMVNHSDKSKWVIARKETQDNTIEDWDNVIRWASQSRHVGGWTDEKTGKVYIDAVDVYDSSYELPEILAIAKERGQIAVYDLVNQETTYL